MPIYDLKEYSNNYSKTSDCLWQYYTDKPASAIENSESVIPKIRVTGKSPADGNAKDVTMEVV